MKKVLFKGKVLVPLRDNYVGLDDIVSVNGIIGWLDFIGEDMIAVVDEKEILHRIAIKDIRSVVKYSNFIEGNLCSVAIKELLAA